MTMEPHKESLMTRLGGAPALRAAVNEFYRRILSDERLSFFFDDTKMAMLKIHQLEFFKLAFTEIAEEVDVAVLLLQKHERLFAEKGLNETHFDMVAGHFVGTLQHLGISQELIDEAVGVIAPLRPVFEEGGNMYDRKGDTVQEEEKKEDVPALAREKEPTVADKLGGVPALKAAVEEFYKRLLEDPELGYFFENYNMTALKMHQLQFMKIAFTLIPEDMDVAALIREKHAKLFDEGLNERHFDKVAAHFVATLKHLGIQEDLVNEAAGVILPLRPVFEQGVLDAAERRASACLGSRYS